MSFLLKPQDLLNGWFKQIPSGSFYGGLPSLESIFFRFSLPRIKTSSIYGTSSLRKQTEETNSSSGSFSPDHLVAQLGTNRRRSKHTMFSGAGNEMGHCTRCLA